MTSTEALTIAKSFKATRPPFIPGIGPDYDRTIQWVHDTQHVCTVCLNLCPGLVLFDFIDTCYGIKKGD